MWISDLEYRIMNFPLDFYYDWNQEWRKKGSRKGGKSNGMDWRQMEKWWQVSDCGLKWFKYILEWCQISDLDFPGAAQKIPYLTEAESQATKHLIIINMIWMMLLINAKYPAWDSYLTRSIGTTQQWIYLVTKTGSRLTWKWGGGKNP